MKHLLAGLIVMVGAVSVSMAKDAPFPIEASQGTWQAVGGSTQLKIQVLKRSQDKVLVQILAKTKRNLVAAGITVFDRKSKVLETTLIYPDGKHLAIALKAEYVIPMGSVKPVLQLHMDMIELDSPSHSVVPSSLVKIAN